MPHDDLESHLSPGEAARFWRVPEGDTEVLLARFRRHSFAPHTHDRYVFGVITAGVEGFQSGGTRHYATRGALALVHPGEVHDGYAAVEEGWAYRMLYLDPALMQRAAEGVGFRASDGLPNFRETIIHDPALAALCAGVFVQLAEGETLERETALLSVLAALVQRHSTGRMPLPGRVKASARVQRAAARLQDDPTAAVSLADLADETGLSAFQLIRAFHAAYGLPPHAFQKLARLRRAEEGLRRGEAIADVAAACGFSDQAHLTRAFKAFRGVTPGQFRLLSRA
ncbi:MAG: AraC family transcriptional regulator [Elstera sp.]